MFVQAILSQGVNGEGATEGFVTLLTSGVPSGMPSGAGRSDYWSLTPTQARELGVSLIEKATLAEAATSSRSMKAA